jgi:hypothetical protein
MKVDLPEGEVDGLRIEHFEVTGQELWNLRAELRYGRGCQPGTYTKLVDDREKDNEGSLLWMSDTTAERADHAFAVAAMQMGKASRVLINGLGIGMVVAAALTFDHVRRVQVVETSGRVIKLVGPHYTKDPRVEIIHADAYEQTKAWPRGARWDVVWSDIWPEISAANLEGMDRLHKYYNPRSNYHGMWARKECLRLRRELKAYGLV